jgi:hypothetical protein
MNSPVWAIIVGAALTLLNFIDKNKLSIGFKRLINIAAIILILVGAFFAVKNLPKKEQEPKITVQNNPLKHDTITQIKPNPSVIPIVECIPGAGIYSPINRINDSVARIYFSVVVLNDGIIKDISFRATKFILYRGKCYEGAQKIDQPTDNNAINKTHYEGFTAISGMHSGDSIFLRFYITYKTENNSTRSFKRDFFMNKDVVYSASGTVSKDTLNKYLR